jgi:transcriptional regulator with PAS, ATPase and Fis domain
MDTSSGDTSGSKITADSYLRGLAVVDSKIAVIVSSLKLAQLAARVTEGIEIYNSSLDTAIPIGRDLETKRIEVVVSLGGTAAILEKNLSIPVLSIPVSAFDLMENFVEAAKYGKNIGICLYGKPVSKIDILERILQVQIRQVIYRDLETIRIGIMRAKEEGVQVFIGGNTTCQIAQEIGVPSVLISGTQETVANTIEEARKVVSIRREEREKIKRIEAILNSVSEGVVVIDKKGIVIVFNKAAEEILEMKATVGSHIDMVIPQLGLHEVLISSKTKLHCVERVGRIEIVINAIPIYLGGEVIGAIASFSDVPKVMKMEQKVRSTLARRFVAKYTTDNIVCESQAMQHVMGQMAQFANSDSTLLITGESGTGKELVAHSIHNLSHKKRGPFVTINCLAIPENLLESELFGHEEGAFTGAKRGGKMGLFELAHKGTIFLDEIGSISENLQASLLRVLQQKEVMRIGGDRIIPVDVRIIAATNRDLLNELSEGKVRVEFFFRLNILRLHIPPLRERKEDIPHLLTTLLNSYENKYQKKMQPLSGTLLKKFMDYSWPGNVRELENFIERFVLMADKPNQYESVLEYLFEDCRKTERVLFKSRADHISSTEDTLQVILNKPFTKKMEVAKRLGISRTTLWRRLRSTEETME